jgi:citrate lyase subunit beta/citryl-CoA lyase
METAAARILPITTETPRAIFRLDSYAGACDRLAGLSWGAEDLSAAVGASSARDEGGALRPLCELARSLCLAGAAAAGVAAVETVYPNFRDLAGLTACADRARRDGFAGMMAIHPCQVATINLAFTPSPDEVERARRIVALFAEDPGAGVLSLDGTMLDAVHLKQAHRTLDRIQDGEI